MERTQPSVSGGSSAASSDAVGALGAGHGVCRYEVERVLGRGGMATVYLVRHVTLGTLHALKVLDTNSPLIRERLLLEGRVQARLRHPNLVSVTDVLDVHGAPGLLMEYVAGPTLDTWIRGTQPDLQAASQMFCGILSAMEQAHALGYVHRDLKPGNVLLKRDIGRWIPKVTDFGIAKVLHRDSVGHETLGGVPVGTPAFMAPEQIRRAQAVDERADIFSLGCILYQLVTHELAFPGESMIEVFNAVSEGRYRDPTELVPDLPVAIHQGIRGALEPDAERRIPDCTTLRRVLSGQQAWGAESTAPPSFQLPACAVPAPMVDDDPTEIELPLPERTDAGRALSLPTAGAEWLEGGARVSGPTLYAEPAKPAEPRGPRPGGWSWRPALFSGLASAAAVGLLWALVGGRAVTSLPVSDELEAPMAVTAAARVAPPLPLDEREPVVVPSATTDPVEPLPAEDLEVPAGESPTPLAPASAAAAPPPRSALPATGSVTVSGDHLAATLIDEAGGRHEPGALPPGTYDLFVRFPSGRSIERASMVTVEAGRSLELRCSSLMENCR